ncbi:hypothetical protein T484DRAFT_1887916 [Baffinella frigidus]|nr:hypothetical protein T484DRAFT_1887916 [Cryptophyta sp. CCMP2293]
MRITSWRRPPDRGSASLAWTAENSSRVLAKTRRMAPVVLCCFVALVCPRAVVTRVAATVQGLAVRGWGRPGGGDADAGAHSRDHRLSGNCPRRQVLCGLLWLRLRGGMEDGGTLQGGEAGRGGGEAARGGVRRTRRLRKRKQKIKEDRAMDQEAFFA